MNLLAQAMASGTTWTRLTALVVIALGAVDSFVFHRWGTNTDLVMIVGAAAALGVHVAMTASAAAAAKAQGPQ